MYIDVEFNMLPVEVLYEENGVVYGVLSRRAPIDPTMAELLRKTISDPKGYEVDASLDFLRSHLKDFVFPQLPMEALPEFINLEEGNTQQAIDYLRRYGLYSLYDLRTPGLSDKIQSYWTEAHINRQIPFAIRLEHIWQSQKILGEAIKLAIAFRENDEAAAISIVESSGYSQREVDIFYKGSWPKSARGLFCFSSDILLHGAKLGVKDKNGKLVLTVTSYGFHDALALLTLDYLSQETPVGECQNPQCKKLFFVTRKSKKFCSARCQSLIKVHRYRNNLELKKTKQQRTNRKSTKRKGGR
jgi:hypothetical protein